MTREILSDPGCLLGLGGLIACVVLAILVHPWFFVGVFLLLGVWIAYINIREKQHRRAYLSAFEDAFERFGGRAPALEIKSSYGFPAFTITFESEEDLEKAESEGYTNIGRLFKAASEAEAIHAKKLMKATGMIGSTVENLEKAVAGETYEFSEMYPKFVKEAEEEKKSDVLLAFNYALEAEKVHADYYGEALKSLKSGQDMSNRTVWLCPVCGNIFLGQAPDKCPICKVFKKVFKEIV